MRAMTHGRRSIIAAVAVMIAVLIFHATGARAHPVQRQGAREIVRIQGYRTAESPAAMKRRVTLAALGAEHLFAATDWQVFGFADEGGAAPTAGSEQQRYALQGSREDLAKFATARPDQRITLLAEHRPGSSDLFVLSLDLCPE